MIQANQDILASDMVTLARYGVDSVGTDAYAITSHSPITAYASGQKFRFKAGTANTGACSLNVDGLGAKTIKKEVAKDLVNGDILVNQIVEVVYDGTNMQLVSSNAQVYGGCGDGVDGDVTISSPVTLTRDMFYNNLTVNSTLTTDGYRIFVKDTLSGSGTIKWGVPNAGGNGQQITANTNAGGGSAGAQSGSGDLKNMAGQTGGTNGSCTAGGAGGSGGVANPCIGSIASNGGIGGGATTGSFQRGVAGNGGTVVAPVRIFGEYREYTINCIDRSGLIFSFIIPQASAGGGGGGGYTCNSGGNGHNGGGGGGGASGGIIMIVARNITGTFTIEANGANGGNGASATFTDGGGGGGGAGGNGGHIVIISVNNTHTGTKTVNAGNGGTAGTSTAGVAPANGNNGTAGSIKLISLIELI